MTDDDIERVAQRRVRCHTARTLEKIRDAYAALKIAVANAPEVAPDELVWHRLPKKKETGDD